MPAPNRNTIALESFPGLDDLTRDIMLAIDPSSWPLWTAMGVLFAFVLIAYMAAIGDDEPARHPGSSFDL